MTKETSKTVALYGVMVTLSLIFSYLESRIPMFIAVPGIKVGLTNIVVISMLYLRGEKSAIAINFVRILLAAVLFGSTFSFLYSLAGAVLSILVMILLKRTGIFHIVTVSIAGAVSHNVGQIIVAAFLVKSTAVAWYMVVLWISGIVSGTIIGLLGAMIVIRVRKSMND